MFSKVEIDIMDNKDAKEFMEENHYTKSCAKSTIAYSYWYEDELCGVVLYGQPSGRNLAKSIWEGGSESECLELLRLFFYDWCPDNIESWAISQSVKMLKNDMPDVKVLVSYADRSAGHVGYIYQASNWLYSGEGSMERKFFIDGKRQHRRNLYDIYGTSSIVKLKELLGDRFEISDDRIGKYRYVYVIGHSKKSKKDIMKKLKFEKLEYPKGDIKYYDTTNNEYDNI